MAALAIASFLVYRHLSTQSTYHKLEAVAGFDRDKLVDTSVEPSDYGLEIDWDALKAINSEIVGWLYVPGTNLSYPIVHGSDNDFYLNHTADKSANSSGAIFLDYENSSDFTDLSTFVYGHNMLGNTMFSELTGYVDQQFLRDHPRIMIFTPTNVYDLTVIGAMKCKGTDPVRRTGFSNQDDFANYLVMLGNYQVSGNYQSLVQASNIYCFSTCELFDLTSRVIVMATDTARVTGATNSFTAIAGTIPAAAILSTYQSAHFKMSTSSRRPTRKDS